MASTLAKKLLLLQRRAPQEGLQFMRRCRESENSVSRRTFWPSSRRSNSNNSTNNSNAGSAAPQSGSLAEAGGNAVTSNSTAPGEEAAKLAADSAAVPPRNSRTVRGGPVSWASLALLVVTGGGLLAYYDREKRRRIEDLKQGANAEVSVGKAAIGGPFKLVNHEGKVVTDRDFVGNWTIVYFGFTFCPDICPDELTKLAKAVDEVEKQIGLKIVPLFISVDPERDSVEQVREYLKDFHPRLVGLTGSVNDVRQAAREYRVYYMKTDEEGSEYLVDHSIIMYLMDPDMEFVKFFGKNYTAETLTSGIIEEIQNSPKKTLLV